MSRKCEPNALASGLGAQNVMFAEPVASAIGSQCDYQHLRDSA